MNFLDDYVKYFINIKHNQSYSKILASIPKWDVKFFNDMYFLLLKNGNISTAQYDLCIKLIKKHSLTFINTGVDEKKIDYFLLNPKARKEPYQTISIPREARYIGKEKIAFRFKYNPKIIEEIKNLKSKALFNENLTRYYTDDDIKLWIVKVRKSNIDKIIDILAVYKFNVDEETIVFLANCKDSIELDSTVKVINNELKITSMNNQLFYNQMLLLKERNWNV